MKLHLSSFQLQERAEGRRLEILVEDDSGVFYRSIAFVVLPLPTTDEEEITIDLGTERLSNRPIRAKLSLFLDGGTGNRGSEEREPSNGAPGG